MGVDEKMFIIELCVYYKCAFSFVCYVFCGDPGRFALFKILTEFHLYVLRLYMYVEVIGVHLR